MSRMVWLFSLILKSLFIQGCAIAPFTNSYSAKTIGENHWAIQGGVSEIAEFVPFLRVGYGVTENSESGLMTECQSASCILGAYAKYAFISPLQGGLASSFEGSVGGGDQVFYAYLGNLIGYQYKWTETVLVTRLNYVKNNHDDSSYKWSQLDADSYKREYYYLGLTLGSTFWVNQSVGLNFNINRLFGDVERTYAGAGVILKI